MNHQVPRIAVIAGTGCDHLGAVDCGAAANGENHVDARGLARLDAAANGLDAGVGLYARELLYLDTDLAENAQRLVVDAVALDGAATIAEQGLLAVLGKLGKVRDLALAKVDGGGNVEREVVHAASLLVPVGAQLQASRWSHGSACGTVVVVLAGTQLAPFPLAARLPEAELLREIV